MPKLLPGRFFAILFCVVSFLAAYQTKAQVGCGGFNGAPQPSGGVNSLDNGSICLNDASPVPAQIEIVASNVADGSNPNNFAVVIDWNDGSPLQTIPFGGAIPVINTGPHAYRIPSITHQFLPRACGGAAGRQCAYKPRVYLRIAGITCSAEFGNPPDFFRFNTDDQCSGEMNLSETATSANVFEVCAGAQSTVTFTDRTILNCLPPQELTGLNSSKRWRRFVYGTTNTITGPVLIDGAAQGMPFNGAVAISGEPLNSSNPPFATNVTQSITIPATATVGQEFHIRMDYWNFCNQYDDGVGAPPANGDRPAVSVTGIIRVVDRPTAPTATHQIVCNGTNPLPNFRIDFTATSSRVFWYRDNAGVPGAAVTNPNGGNSKDFPASAFPGGITNTTAGVYRMWANYRAQVGAGGPLCESILVPVTLTIRESLAIPGAITGTTEVCNGSTGVSYTVPIPAATMPFGGATEYNVRIENSGGTARSDVTLTLQGDGRTFLANFNLPAAEFGGGASTTRRIRIRQRYTSPSTFPGTSTCPSGYRNFDVTVYRNTDAGTISGGDTKCQGELLTGITWTPGIGNIVRWEISNNGGTSYSTIASFGTSNPVDPTTLGLTPGSYLIRAQIQNGVCVAVPTAAVAYVINPNTDVANAGPNQNGCFLPAALLQFTLAGNTPAVGTGQWSYVSGPDATPTFSDASSPTSTVTVDLPGSYVLRWEISTLTCSSIDDVELDFGREPSNPVAGIANTFCALTGTLSATAPTYENAQWTVAAGAPGAVTFTDDTSPTTDVTVSAYGTYTFIWTLSSGSCAPKQATVDITFAEPPVAVPEASKIVCLDAGSLTPFSITGGLTGGSAGGGSGQGQWEIFTGSGTFTSSNAATGSAIVGPTINDNYRPSAADYTNGFVILRLRALGGLCPAGTDTVRVIFDRNPAAAAIGPNFSTCSSDATLNAVAPTNGGIGIWSIITAGPNIADPLNRTSNVSDLQMGANIFTWTVNSALGTCTPTSTNLTITRVNPPVANNLNPNDLCETNPNTGIAQNVNLSAGYNGAITGGAAGVNVVWFTNPARTTVVADSTSRNVTDGTVFYIRVSTTGTPVCSTDGVVTFTVNAKPFVSNLNPSLCEDVLGGGTRSDIDLTDYDDDAALGIGNRAVTWFTDAALTIPVPTPNDIDNIVNDSTFYARVENTVSGCFNVAEVKFKINTLPDDNPISGPDKVCLDPNEVIFFQVATLKADHTYQWTIPSPPNGAVNVTGITTDFFVLLQFPNVVAGGVDITVVETTPEGCSGNLQSLNVTIEDKPNTLTIAGPDEVCEDETGVEFVADLFPAITYAWDVPPGASIILGQGSNTIRVNFSNIPGDIVVTPSTPSGCTGDQVVKPIAINERPDLADLDKTVCSKQDAEITLAVAAGSELADHYDIPALGMIVDAGLVRTSGVSVPPAIAGANDQVLFDQAFENRTGGPLNVRYTIIPVSAENCSGAAEVVTLRVNPEPELDPNLGKSLCSGFATEVTLRPDVGSFPADRYIIQSITSGGLSTVGPLPPTNTPLMADAIYNDQWINEGTAQVNVTYEIAPMSTSTGCVGDPPIPITIAIYPKPLIVPVANKVICSDDAVNLSLNSSNIPTASIAWTVDNISGNILGATTGTATTLPATIPDVLRNLDAVRGSLEYHLVAKNPALLLECVSDPVVVTVEVDPSPQATSLTPEACSDDANGPLVYTETLADLEPFISSTPGVAITWYSDAALTTVIPGPDYQFSNLPVYVEVENTTSGCTKLATVTYTINPQVSFDVDLSDHNGFNLFCGGDNSGEITVNALTGTPLFSYRLDGGPFLNSGNTYTFKFLGAGSHSLEVQDAKGCTESMNVVLVEPPALTADLVIDEPIKCFLGKDAVLVTNAQGGTGSYTNYLLLQTNTSNTTGRFENLGIGAYNVRVTDSNGCSVDSDQTTLTQPDQVEVDAAVVTDGNGFPLSCKDAQDGQIDVTAAGGVTGTDYTYTLVRSGDPLNPFREILDATAAESFLNLPFGTYTIRATDNNGCQSLPSVAVIVNPPPFNGGFVGINQSICVGDSPMEIEELVPAFGGVGDYQFQWQQSLTGSNNDAEWFDIPGANGTQFTPPAITETVYYRRLVTTGSCGIQGKDNKVEITVNPLPVVTFEAPAQACQGESFFIQLNVLEGTAPIEYDYSSGSTVFSNLIGTENTIIPISNFSESTTYTLLRVKDLNNCVAASLPPPRTVDIIKINPAFDIIAPDAQCSGGQFTFEWRVEPDVKYTWLWADNTSDVINPGDRPLGVNTITHIFPDGSAQNSTIYPVRLQAENAICIPKFASKPVTIYPTIALNILPGDTIICGGETVQFRDQSLGIDVGTWYYRELGSNDRLEETPGPVGQVTYTMNNNTTQNPITYEVVYEVANDEGCTDEFRNQVVVYRGVNADFSIGPVPPFTGGASEVTFTNTSTPIDATAFEYVWNFGDSRAAPSTANGTGPYDVEYYSPGIKDIVLRVTNIQARDAGETCQSNVTKQINIMLPVLDAAFTATPRASCFPVDIVVENLSPGADTFMWELYNQSGLVSTSNLRNPVFRILNPGTYDIYLTASYSATNQTANAELKGIEVFDQPSAIFELRPNPVYVPDTEIRTFNFSTRANQYAWDFDDGATYTDFEPRHTYKLEGKYKVTLIASFNNGSKDIDGNGTLDGDVVCYDTAQVEVVALDGGFLKIPNAFTPNPNGSTGGSGIPGSGSFNDVFLPITKGVEEFTMQVFDRWGTMIFETSDKNVGWDGYDRNGRLMPAGVYVYKLVMRLSDGQRTTKVGDVTLIR